MYEFHGWVKLAESSSEIDEGDLDAKCEKLRDYLSAINWASGKAEILLLNGFYTLVVHAIPNRRRTEATELRALLEYVAKEFGGAYGLVYEFDEQTEIAEGHGVFSVNVIKRGRRELLLDPFLSPVVPVVEEP